MVESNNAKGTHLHSAGHTHRGCCGSKPKLRISPENALLIIALFFATYLVTR